MSTFRERYETYLFDEPCAVRFIEELLNEIDNQQEELTWWKNNCTNSCQDYM